MTTSPALPEPVAPMAAPKRRPIAAQSIGFILFLVMLAGCSGSDDNPTDDAYAEIFGVSDPDEIRRLQFRELTTIEETVSGCMSGLGFVYEPVVYEDSESFALQEIEDRDTFVDQYGYGIVEQATRGSELGPNESYVEGLTDNERVAYATALAGEYGGGGQAGPAYDHRATSDEHSSYVWYLANVDAGGCFGEAIADASYMNQVLDVGTEAFTNAQEQLEADENYQQALSDWRECMAGQGYQFNEPFDAENDVLVRLGPLVAGGDPGRPEIESELGELADYERQLAGADLGCGRQALDDRADEVSRAVTVELVRGEVAG